MFRNECLSESWFIDMHEARQKIKAWRGGPPEKEDW
ncbi:MAG: transposase [Chlorobiaceae bacterium]|nr:transposase [Chlorobiaceae bacterium]NTV16560.1 transposase [Chlorobiaceae bacterium]